MSSIQSSTEVECWWTEHAKVQWKKSEAPYHTHHMPSHRIASHIYYLCNLRRASLKWESQSMNNTLRRKKNEIWIKHDHNHTATIYWKSNTKQRVTFWAWITKNASLHQLDPCLLLLSFLFLFFFLLFLLSSSLLIAKIYSSKRNELKINPRK